MNFEQYNDLVAAHFETLQRIATSLYNMALAKSAHPGNSEYVELLAKQARTIADVDRLTKEATRVLGVG